MNSYPMGQRPSRNARINAAIASYKLELEGTYESELQALAARFGNSRVHVTMGTAQLIVDLPDGHLVFINSSDRVAARPEDGFGWRGWVVNEAGETVAHSGIGDTRVENALDSVLFP